MYPQFFTELVNLPAKAPVIFSIWIFEIQYSSGFFLNLVFMSATFDTISEPTIVNLNRKTICVIFCHFGVASSDGFAKIAGKVTLLFWFTRGCIARLCCFREQDKLLNLLGTVDAGGVRWSVVFDSFDSGRGRQLLSGRAEKYVKAINGWRPPLVTVRRRTSERRVNLISRRERAACWKWVWTTLQSWDGHGQNEETDLCSCTWMWRCHKSFFGLDFRKPLVDVWFGWQQIFIFIHLLHWPFL